MEKPKKSTPRKKATVKKTAHTITIDDTKLQDIFPAAKTVLEKFLNAWMSRDYNTMVDNCNKSWLFDGHPMCTALGWITINLGINDLQKYEILDGWRAGEAMLSVYVKAVINDTKCDIKINVLCETAPYCPDVENGTWGVNPVSANQIKWEK